MCRFIFYCFIQGTFGFSIGFDFVRGGAQFVQFEIVDVLGCVINEFFDVGFGYDFIGLDALVQIHERHDFDAPRFIQIYFGWVVLLCERVVSEFVFELVLGFNVVDVHGHSVINDDGAVGGVHDDVSFRQVEVNDFVRV